MSNVDKIRQKLEEVVTTAGRHGGLYPTKTRLALLRAVADGDVIEAFDDERDTISTFDTTGAEDGEPARRVTARVEEMVRAGWVAYDGITLVLTDAGRAVLDGAA